MTRPRPEALGATITAILTRIQDTLPGGTAGQGRATWLCGACGCLCFAGETCPKCRRDLMAKADALQAGVNRTLANLQTIQENQ